MNNHFFLILLAFCSLTSTATVAQAGDPVASVTAVESAHYPATDTAPLSAVDRAPSLTGIQPDVRRWVMERIHYPDLAQENAVEGRVVIAYLVGANGEISDIRVHEKLGFGCDEAALTVFRNMPRWNPAVRNGRTVAVQCYTPIDFKLQ